MIKTAVNCQTLNYGRNEIITITKILWTNQMVLIINCDFSSIIFGRCN